MKDFRIVHAKTRLKVTAMTPVRGVFPPTIQLRGEKLNLAREVFYNGIEARDFVVVSPNSLLVRVPRSQLGKPFADVAVLAEASVAKTSSEILLQITKSSTVSGMDRLIQSWLILFLTTPGSSVFSPNSGGGGKGIIGRNTDKQGRSVAADLAQAIERTTSELLNTQAQRQLPPEEKLLSAALQTVDFDELTGTLSAVVNLQNMLGDSADVTLG